MTSIIFQKRDNKDSDFDSDSEITSIVENVNVQLEWIKRIQDQVDFVNNNPDVIPDFWIYFKVQLRKERPPL